MPLVKVTWLAGRTKEQKQQIADAVTDALTDIGNAYRDRVDVVFEDVPWDDWATGGVFSSDRSSGWSPTGGKGSTA